MFGTSLMRATGLVRNARCFGRSAVLRDVKPVATPPTSAATPKSVDPERVIGAKMHRCSNFDKWLLVWLKKYPNKEAVPEKITVDVLHTVQSKARIRVANFMIFFTILGCVWAVISGKREARAGHTIVQQNKDWHAQINKDYKASIEAPKTV